MANENTKYHQGKVVNTFGPKGYGQMGVAFEALPFRSMKMTGVKACGLKHGDPLLVLTDINEEQYNGKIRNATDTSGCFKIIGAACLGCLSVNDCDAVLPESQETRDFEEFLRPEGESFCERLQEELAKPIMYRKQIREKIYIYDGLASTGDPNSLMIPSENINSRMYLRKNGECSSVQQSALVSHEPEILLIEHFGEEDKGKEIGLYVQIRTPESTTSQGIFLDHKVSKDRMSNQLIIPLQGEGIERVISHLKRVKVEIPDNEAIKRLPWKLNYKEGVWHIESDFEGGSLSHFISDESLNKLEIDNVPSTIKLGDPAVNPMYIKNKINGKVVEITIPPDKDKNDSSLRERIISGQLMIPALVKINKKEEKWRKER